MSDERQSRPRLTAQDAPGRPSNLSTRAIARTRSHLASTRAATNSNSAQARERRAPGSESTGGSDRRNSVGNLGRRVRGRPLRIKLMFAMAGMTAATLLILGATLSAISDRYLFGQTLHRGVELAKMTAQVGRLFQDAYYVPGAAGLTEADRETYLNTYLNNARTWGTDDRYSDILGVTFDGGNLSGKGVGERITGAAVGSPMAGFPLPRLGYVRLPADISISESSRRTESGSIPVFRFKVALNRSLRRGGGGGEPYLDEYVWVDLAADKVLAVRNQLFLIMFVTVVLSMAVVLWLANLIANSITKPVRILMQDMDVVANGNLDHQTRAHSNDEVGVLAGTFNDMTRRLKAAQEAMVEQEKAEYELSIAREVQHQLLPAAAPEVPGYEACSFYRGAKAVSGDYFDFIPLSDGRWGLIVADVSGKGIPGSMVMAVTRTIVRLVADQHRDSAAATLRDTNRLIAKQIKRGMFVTAFYAILDPPSGRVIFASAGHNPMVVYRGATRACELCAPKGIAIGFNDGPVFDKTIQESVIVLAPSDLFVLYTDGYPEAMNEAQEEFGDERFYAHIAASGHAGAQAMVDYLRQAVDAHRGSAPQSDDLTMVALRRLPAV